MGNVCCNYGDLGLGPKGDRPEALNRLQPDAVGAGVKAPEAMIDPRSVSLFDQMGRVALEALVRQGEDFVNNDEVHRNAKNRLVTEKFKLFGSDYSFWADFQDLPSKNKLHCYFHQLEYPFTPELYFLFSLQHTLDSFGRVDDSLDELEVLNFQVQDDMLVKLVRTRTKKIMVIEPRSFLVLSVVKRLSKDKVIEVQKSVQLTTLSAQEPWQRILSEQFNLAELKMSACVVERVEGKTVMRNKSEVDILSSTGPIILKMALKGKFSRMYKNSVKEALRFVLRTGEADFRNLLWFTNAPDELKRILSENKTLAAEANLNMAELDNSEKEEVTSGIRSHSNAGEKEEGAVAPQDSLEVRPETVGERRVSQPIQPAKEVTGKDQVVLVEGRTDSPTLEVRPEDLSPPKNITQALEPAKLIVPTEVKATELSPAPETTTQATEAQPVPEKKEMDFLEASKVDTTATQTSQAPTTDTHTPEPVPVLSEDTKDTKPAHVSTLEPAKPEPVESPADSPAPADGEQETAGAGGNGDKKKKKNKKR